LVIVFKRKYFTNPNLKDGTKSGGRSMDEDQMIKVTKNKTAFLTICALFVLMIKGISCAPARNMKGVHLGDIILPPGFSINIYADDVENAQSLALGDNGTLFVGTRLADKVYAVLDRNHDARADDVITIAEGLDLPNGVAFRKGFIFLWSSRLYSTRMVQLIS